MLQGLQAAVIKCVLHAPLALLTIVPVPHVCVLPSIGSVSISLPLTPEAVDSENSKNLQSDPWRLLQVRANGCVVSRRQDRVTLNHLPSNGLDPLRRLLKLYRSLSRPDHPFHKFGTGNHEVLWREPRGGSGGASRREKRDLVSRHL